jgi:photosystem II stability/assembly factor-like uncharacterized protein
MGSLEMYSLTIDPTDSNVMYAGTSGGLCRTKDGGVHWDQPHVDTEYITILGFRVPLGEAPVGLVVVDAVHPQNLYLAALGTVYKSIDYGSNWAKANTGLPVMTIQTILADPHDSNTLFVMMEYPSSDGHGGVYRTNDGGAHWTALENRLPWDIHIYDAVVTPSALYIATVGYGVMKSTDSAESWTAASHGLKFNAVYCLATDGSQTLYAGTFEWGIFKTVDGGANWNLAVNGLLGAETQAVGVDSAGAIFAATYIGPYKCLNEDGEWVFLGQPMFDIPTLAVHPQAPGVLYLGGYSYGITKSLDGGKTWQSKTFGLTSNSIWSLTIDPTSPETVYAGTDKGIFKSTDGGGHWFSASGGLPSAEITFITVDSTNPKTLYAGAYGEGLFKSTDGGQNWIGINSGLDDWLYYSLAIDRTNPQTLYLGSFQYGAYKSIDGGGTWTKLGGGIPRWSIRALVFDPIDASVLYAGTGSGVYKSSDGGLTWSEMDEGLVGYPVYGLAFDPFNPGRLYAATGGGVYSYTRPSVPSARVSLVLPSGGSGTSFTAGMDNQLRSGYAFATSGPGSSPYATAVFSLSQNGVVVSEAGVPASPPTRDAQVFIDYSDSVSGKTSESGASTISVKTGIAIVNSGTISAAVTYTLRKIDGTLVSTGHGALGASEHRALFIDQLSQIANDFVLPADFAANTRFGSLEITSTQPISVLALRQTTNQAGDNLITTTPIADRTQPLTKNRLYFPRIVDGGGWKSAYILMNISAATETGQIEVFGNHGIPLSIRPSGGTSGNLFPYSIPPNGIFVLETDGSPSSVNDGSVQVVPDSQTSSPVGAGIFGFTQNGKLVTESGIPATVLTTHARIYIDKANGHDTGLAIADPSNDALTASLAAFQSDGVTLAGTGQGTLTIEGNGERAAFVGSFVSGLPDGFTGVLDVSSSSPFAALTLRTLYNTRGEFLITTFPIADFNQLAPSPIVFPQVADGGQGERYQTQFIFLSPFGPSTTILNLYGDNGTPLPIGR